MTEPVQPRPSPYMSDRALASDPGGVTIAPDRLKALSPSLFGAGSLLPSRAVARKTLSAHLWNGDSRAAVVLSIEPLLVAAYSDDFDAVVVLRFDPRPVDVPLQVGSRLLTINTYFSGGTTASDIVRGPRASQTWSNFHPVIADFVAAERSRVEGRKATISEPEWQRTWLLGQQYLGTRPGRFRDGAPHLSKKPAS
ncbi:hypothetical protein GCM10022197_04580 [Microlunatus spumicola]|uniref:Uncharacterized protein n=1 Tax=Microlunatus spumicola TaxID=81499 RepID=A0ABP6WJW2_9ACTN